PLVHHGGRHLFGKVGGKTPYMQAVQIESAAHRIGDRVLVQIERAGSNSLFGRAVE
ncbi:MAG: TRAM domain-containing protein, partial [Hyphomicrobiales bacterium]